MRRLLLFIDPVTWLPLQLVKFYTSMLFRFWPGSLGLSGPDIFSVYRVTLFFLVCSFVIVLIVVVIIVIIVVVVIILLLLLHVTLLSFHHIFLFIIVIVLTLTSYSSL